MTDQHLNSRIITFDKRPVELLKIAYTSKLQLVRHHISTVAKHDVFEETSSQPSYCFTIGISKIHKTYPYRAI